MLGSEKWVCVMERASEMWTNGIARQCHGQVHIENIQR